MRTIYEQQPRVLLFLSCVTYKNLTLACSFQRKRAYGVSSRKPDSCANKSSNTFAVISAVISAVSQTCRHALWLGSPVVDAEGALIKGLQTG